MIVHKPMEMNGDDGWMLLESGGTPTKMSKKQVQSTLKSYVNSQGKLLLTWQNDIKSIESILNIISNLESTLKSIDNYTKLSYFECDKSDFQSQLEDIRPRLVGKIYLELETLRKQLKSYWLVSII